MLDLIAVDGCGGSDMKMITTMPSRTMTFAFRALRAVGSAISNWRARRRAERARQIAVIASFREECIRLGHETRLTKADLESAFAAGGRQAVRKLLEVDLRAYSDRLRPVVERMCEQVSFSRYLDAEDDMGELYTRSVDRIARADYGLSGHGRMALGGTIHVLDYRAMAACAAAERAKREAQRRAAASTGPAQYRCDVDGRFYWEGEKQRIQSSAVGANYPDKLFFRVR